MKEPLFREKWNTDAPLPTSVMSEVPAWALGPFDIVVKRNLTNEHKENANQPLNNVAAFFTPCTTLVHLFCATRF